MKFLFYLSLSKSLLKEKKKHLTFRNKSVLTVLALCMCCFSGNKRLRVPVSALQEIKSTQMETQTPRLLLVCGRILPRLQSVSVPIHRTKDIHIYTYLLSFMTTECSKASDKNALQKYTILSLTDNSHSSMSYMSEMQLYISER